MSNSPAVVGGGDAALDVARLSESAPFPCHEAGALAVEPGCTITIRASDSTEIQFGILAAATRDRIVIVRESSRVGCVHLHFPRIGYLVSAAAPA